MSTSTDTPIISEAPQATTTTPSISVIKTREGAITKVTGDGLTGPNWVSWQVRMKSLLALCEVEPYVRGEIAQPNKEQDPTGHDNWKKNDNYAKHLITQNVGDEPIIHIQHGLTSHVAWKNLEAIYEDKSQETAVAIIRNLWHTTANESADVSEHLNTMKKYWERLNLVDDNNFKIPEVQFKIAIVSSLPPSWDNFTRPYISIRKDDSTDPKLKATSQELIGILKEEYVRRQRRAGNSQMDEINQASTSKPSLLGRMNTNTERCGHCGLRNHKTEECKFLGQSKCGICTRFGHTTEECYSKKAKDLKRKREKGDKKGKKKKKTEEMHQGEEIADDDEDEHITFNLNESPEIFLDESEEGQSFNFDEPDVINSSEYNPRLIYYDWLGDTATTSHVSNRRDAFKTFQPLTDTKVSGVGNVKAEAKGRGIVELRSSYQGRNHTLELKNVLYIPTNRNNLISLGKWDKAGGRYTGGGGSLTLITKDGIPVARGTQIENNLYKMKVAIRKPDIKFTKEANPQCFVINEPAQSWETWHKRFGHIGYSSLQQILDKNLVEGFNVNTRTPKPDCVACTEAKQSVEPFDQHTEKETEPGDLTHIDLWGKYDTVSINGNQYYLLMVDDSSRFNTTDFLKEKKKAAEKVIEYLAKLISHGRKPKAIRIDRGKEFLNVSSWCQERGIEIQMTAPYSPSQNGVAERMNRTLVEIARAMIRGLPEFLWEYAVSHASYLRNRVSTKRIKGQTPYERWFKKKPNVSHLREFGAPVWVLLQGQKVPRKMETKSRRRTFVGYDDGSKSIKYYNAETRKVLISRNIRFLTLTNDETSPEPMVLLPDAPCEGEPEGGTPPTSVNKGDSLKRKRDQSDEDEEQNMRNTRVKPRMDYRYLNNPFPDEEDEINLTSDEQIYSIIPGDEYTSLKEARNSPDWPEWEKAIQSELAQLNQMGTWRLVEKPPNAIPIANKWTFVRKRNKAGEVVRFKARLVAKGCSQRPGYDYAETFSPVVRMDTIRAILALVPKMGLKICQLDIKGAYLNGILKEKVYMRQPEGYGNGTDEICELLKSLYGLKQAGREWNIEFDGKMKKFGYDRTRSDPCVYIKRDGNDIIILTIWVDDILLFATSEKLIQQTISDIQQIWEVTVLGEPTKIVGIEITQTEDSIKIAQKIYIKSILEREGLSGINSVATPLDLNIKLEPNPDGNEGNRSNSFARLLGELQFLANCTRPDIAFTVNRLASYTANPSLQHFAAVKRILRYLAGTQDHGIIYSKSAINIDKNVFYGFADAAFANHDDLKSTSGYVFLSSGGAITWKSKKQTTIALSSTEAEYVALSEAAREACWLRNLYEELGYSQDFPITIKGDNDGSIAMAKNQQFHSRSKHIAIRWHWVRDLVEQNLVKIETCRDPQQTADVLTKALPRPKHCQHTSEMGIAPT
jgi:Reverse transcriptase (RNA-dependent DNA polymerase)/gag-polypeptide of LTR copia-type/Integrase core domain/GAG-pre-integrase domain